MSIEEVIPPRSVGVREPEGRMSKGDRQQTPVPGHNEHPWQRRIMMIAFIALVLSLCLIASRDGIAAVIPDLWASAGTIAHLFGGSDWPFG